MAQFKTVFDEDQFDRILGIATAFIVKHGSLTNRDLRRETGLSYDQAINFFKKAVQKKVLQRHGRTANIHYCLPGCAIAEK